MDEVFEVSDQAVDGYRVVTVSGEVDVATAPRLRDGLESAVGAAPARLVVDLSSVSFIDSTGLGVLIGVSKQADEAGVALRLVIAESRIIKLFEITGLLDLFTIVPTREQAIEG